MEGNMWVFFILFATPVFADQVCLDRKTGKLIEYQSKATPGTCLINAISAGYTEENVEERQVSLDEWAYIKEELVDKPEREDKEAKEQAKEIRRDQKEQSIRTKLGLSAKEFQDLKEALGVH